jgi:hypothetical protein
MFNHFFPENRAFYGIMWKVRYSQTGHRDNETRQTKYTISIPDN